jgi:hypothetical protein
VLHSCTTMTSEEIEELCDALAELASQGPSQNPRALIEARSLLRKAQSPEATAHVRERASDVERALSGWFDSEERFHALLRSHKGDIYALIDRLHGALREASRFTRR